MRRCRSSRFVVPVSAVSVGSARSTLDRSERRAFSKIRVRRQVGALFGNRVRGSRRTAPPVVPGSRNCAVVVSAADGWSITASRISAIGCSAVPRSTFGPRARRVNYSLSSLLPAQYLRPMSLGNSTERAPRGAGPNQRLQPTVNGGLRPPSPSSEACRWAS